MSAPEAPPAAPRDWPNISQDAEAQTECDGIDMKCDVSTTRTLRSLTAVCLLTFVCLTSAAESLVIEMDLPGLGVVEKASNYIVQAADVDAAAEAVQKVGGTVTDEMGMIRAVRATLLPAQVELLRRRSDVVRVSADTTVQTSSNVTRISNAGSSSFRSG